MMIDDGKRVVGVVTIFRKMITKYFFLFIFLGTYDNYIKVNDKSLTKEGKEGIGDEFYFLVFGLVEVHND